MFLGALSSSAATIPAAGAGAAYFYCKYKEGFALLIEWKKISRSDTSSHEQYFYFNKHPVKKNMDHAAQSYS